MRLFLFTLAWNNIRATMDDAPGSPKDENSDLARPSWNEYFLSIAAKVSERSTCLRRRCGAVLVKEKRILATGYNGAPSGLKHCAEAGCLREAGGIEPGSRHELCRGLHAEQNAIIQAAMHGVEISGAAIYSTHQPCVLCAKMLINAGVKAVVYREGYPDELALQMLGEAGIPLTRLGGEASSREAHETMAGEGGPRL